MKPMTVMQGQSNLRFVAVPENVSRADKGCTKYDKYFEHLLENREALRMPEDEFDAIRKAAFRFVKFRDLKGKVFVRQRKDARTKTYLLWLQPKGERK